MHIVVYGTLSGLTTVVVTLLLFHFGVPDLDSAIIGFASGQFVGGLILLFDMWWHKVLFFREAGR